jgi:hypothetical protein
MLRLTRPICSCRSDKPNIIDLISDGHLLGDFFAGESWDRWKAILRATFALPMDTYDTQLFTEIAERDPPEHPVRELIAVIGRGGGKNSIASAIATYLACTSDFTKLRPGERGTILCLATDRSQASISWDFIKGYFDACPLLGNMIERTIDADKIIDLKNGARIQVSTANYRAPRGRTIVCVIFDELAFWRDENSLNPDVEIDAAVAPGLMRYPGSLKILISSAYRRQGLLYERYNQFYGKNDPDTLAIKGTSLQFNPLLDTAIIAAELARDKARASAEYLSEWRDDIHAFIRRELLEAAIDTNITERAYDSAVRHYIGFVDEAGGGSDASSACIAHKEKNGIIYIDAIRVFKPPFSPEAVIADKVRLFKSYKISKVFGDRWAKGLVPEAYGRYGMRYEEARAKGDLYIDLLHLLNSQRIRLLDHKQSFNELLALERRTHFGGRETIDHPQGGHDDAANALAGAASYASLVKAPIYVHPEVLARSAVIGRRSTYFGELLP